MSTEPTDIAVSEEQEKTEIAVIAQASIANIAQNTKTYEELRDKYKGTTSPAEFTDPDFKATHKLLTEGYNKLVKGRTAADKLVKQEVDKLKKVETLIKGAGEDLKKILAETEKEVKAEKEKADQIEIDHKAELVRQEEERKQARMLELLDLGFTAKVGYYQLGELNITQMQLINSTQAQWEGYVSQAKVIFEAEQLRIAEEKEAEEKRIADEKAENERLAAEFKKAQEALTKHNAEQQKLLDEAKANKEAQDKLIAELQAKLKAVEPVVQEAPKRVIPASIAGIVNEQPVLNGTPVKFTEEERESILDDVFGKEEEKSAKFYTASTQFSDKRPYIEARVGKGEKAPIFRIYVEEFLEEASAGLTKDQVSASGAFDGTDYLFMVIKPKQ